jgi:hypothetical protein
MMVWIGVEGSKPAALVHGIEQKAVGFQTIGVLGSRSETDFPQSGQETVSDSDISTASLNGLLVSRNVFDGIGTHGYVLFLS